ncbi:MAG: RNA 2',3'-cyclic phosphodiesterase [Candidatus Micrarchaeaceae archaeon]
MRIFIAIDVPEEAKEKAEQVEQEMKALQGSFTFVHKDAMHITLNFIGDANESIVDNAKRALDSIGFAPFDISLHGLSYFSPSFIRVVYIGISRVNDELARLFGLVGEALANEGVPYEHSGEGIDTFIPHFTIARVKYIKEKRPLLELIAKHADDDFGTFRAKSIVLKKSVLTENGPVYSNLHEVKFS